jgi:hypothetical protein
MIDAELRGIVLQDFYSLRNTIAPVHVSDILILLSGNEESRITGICRELDRYNLIEWQEQDSALDSFGSITADGVDVIEGAVLAPIHMILPANDGADPFAFTSAGSGPMTLSREVNYLLAEIDRSAASPLEKVQAKSLLINAAENPLLQTVLVSACRRSLN